MPIIYEAVKGQLKGFACTKAIGTFQPRDKDLAIQLSSIVIAAYPPPKP